MESGTPTTCDPFQGQGALLMNAICTKSVTGSPRGLLLSTNRKDWVDPALYHEQQAILAAMPGSVIYGPGYQYSSSLVSDIVSEVFGDSQPDFIFCYENERRLLGEPLAQATIERYDLRGDMRVFPRGLDELSVPKIAWINDFWHCTRDEWDRILLGNGFQFAFSTYCPPFVLPEVFNHFFTRSVQEAVRFVPWPRSMSADVFRDYGLEKIHDITLLGAMNPGFYPLRAAMHRAFQQQPGIDYFHEPHPGYRFVDSTPALVGEAYARAINESKIFASCTSKYRIPFIKLYEVIGCRTMLLCDVPNGAEHLGLHDGENFVAVDRRNFLGKAMYFLSHPDEIDRISANAGELFLSRHTVDTRAAEFREIITSLLAGREPGSYAALFSPEEMARARRSLRHFLHLLFGGAERLNAWFGLGKIRRGLSRLKRMVCRKPPSTDVG
jgi:hypothetical protein